VHALRLGLDQHVLQIRERPLRRDAPLFDPMRRHPGLLALVKCETPDVYSRWGLWHNDTRLAFDALRPVRWTLRRCPELRCSAAAWTPESRSR
jgi:hypothetical protein